MMTNEPVGPATMIFIGDTAQSAPDLDGLFPDTPDTFVRQICCTSDKPALIEEVTSLIDGPDEAHAIICQKAALMLDEMVENALYAAPRSSDGTLLFPLRASRELLTNEQIVVRYRYDGYRLSMEVRDSWGSLTQAQVFAHLAINTQETEPDPERTGRGLFFMWRLFDQLYVRIYPGCETVIGGSLLLHKKSL